MIRKILIALFSSAMFFAVPVHAQDTKVVLINVFEVPAEQEAEVFQIWLKSRDFLAKQPGYVSTRLHKNLDGNGKFRFINVAEWATPQAFQAATKAMNESPTAKMPDSVKFTPGLFRMVAQ